jgi:hypothetical protein
VAAWFRLDSTLHRVTSGMVVPPAALSQKGVVPVHLRIAWGRAGLSRQRRSDRTPLRDYQGQ